MGAEKSEPPGCAASAEGGFRCYRSLRSPEATGPQPARNPVETTILFDAQQHTTKASTAEGGQLWLPETELEAATGWHLEPRGVCRGEACVPAPAGASWTRDERFNVSAFATHLGRQTARDENSGLWSLGPPTGRAFEGNLAPDFELPDFKGRMHSLSQYRGRKVLLMTWASW